VRKPYHFKCRDIRMWCKIFWLCVWFSWLPLLLWWTLMFVVWRRYRWVCNKQWRM